jgi:Domain of unknown function (DUF4352)
VTEPTRPDVGVWVGRATPRPADPWTPTQQSPVIPAQVPPGYVLLPEQPRRRRGLHAFIIVVGLFAACCAGGATLALMSSSAFRGMGTFGSAPPPPGLNTAVRDGKFEFVVSSVTCGQESVGTLVTKRAQGQFCVVDLTVRNVGTEKQLMLDGVQKAIGTDGAQYGADSGASVIASNGLSVSANLINPGISVAGKIVYDLPDGASIAKLELHDSAFSTGTTVTL